MTGHDGATGSGLELREVAVTFGATTAVDDVSLCIEPAEVVALLGPSGCGKSTLLRAVAGLEPTDRGTVRWAGADLRDVPVHRRGFGLLFQDGQLFPHRDVAGNVEFGLRMAGVNRAGRQARVGELLELVGLSGRGGRRVASLSGGEQQRVALARSLAPRPRLLLLDEPLSALDRGLRERLATDLREILRRTSTTALYVTHDHDEAFTIADRVGVMDHGRLLQIAPAEQLWRRPADEQVAQFLGYDWFVPASALGAARPRGAGPDDVLGLRPESLVVDADGPIIGLVVDRHRTRGGTGLLVHIDGVGTVGARAPGTAVPGPAARVRLRLEAAVTAVLPPA